MADFVVESYELGRRSILPYVSIDKIFQFPTGTHGVLASISRTEVLGLCQNLLLIR